MRATTFWHLGDYGEGPGEMFNIDLFPVVGEPFWTPSDVVSVMGPGAPSEPAPVDPTVLATFEQHRDQVTTGFAAWTATTPAAEDPSVLAEHPDCFANEYFFDNRTIIASDRMAYEADGVSVQVRFDAHESESAASGSAWLGASSVSETCRRRLVESTGPGVASVEHTGDDSTARVSFELDGTGEGLYLDVYSTTIGTTAVRVTTTGPMNESVAETVMAALDGE